MESLQDIDLQTDIFKLSRWLINTNRELFDKLAFHNEIFSKLRIGIFIYDLRKLRHVWTNNNFEKIIGYTQDEMKAMGPEWAVDNFHPDDRHIMQERLDYYKQNKGSSYCSIYRVKHKNGQWVWIYSNTVVYNRDLKGCPTHLLGISINFTESFCTMAQVEELVRENKQLRNKIIVECLSNREKEILKQICQGKISADIGTNLNISPHTVNNHRKRIMKKLEAHNIVQLIRMAEENGLD
ncbi:MAG: LuxR C-terminal-related transcriptional regulator [Bacteroidales bacterium]|nr:LuxR C-terminal-related transcriptional regulator [Bacteroidales bacterium]